MPRLSTAALALLLALGCGGRTGPVADAAAGLKLQVEFEERGALEEGDPVTLRGFDVGRVVSVGLQRRVLAEIFVTAEYADAVPTCAFGLVSTDWYGRSSLEIVVVDPDAPVAKDGTLLPGAVTTSQRIAVEAKLRLGRAMDRLKAPETGEQFAEFGREAERAVGQGASAARKRLGELGEKASGGIGVCRRCPSNP